MVATNSIAAMLPMETVLLTNEMKLNKSQELTEYAALLLEKYGAAPRFGGPQLSSQAFGVRKT
jgi:hypothetical protein